MTTLGISLILENVEVAYGATSVLRGLEFSVQPGEFFCLLGPSGCGKSTLLNVVAGFVPLLAGRVLLGGEDVTNLPPQRRRIGVVFQSYALYPHMTVAQNVGYGLKIQKRPPAQIGERVDEMLALVQLRGKEERYPRQLSGGEQQRVAIARALAVEPRLLLLDEPLSNLDARLRDEMRSELKRIQRATGVTTVFVTHDQAEALGMGDRVAVLNGGQVEQVGAPRDIYRTPRTSFVAGFVGRSNIIRGRVEEVGGRATLSVDGHVFALPPGSSVPSGEAVLFLRPEDLCIGLSKHVPNLMRGTIVDATYGGSLINYRVSTAIGELEVCQLGTDATATEVGAVVHVGWPPEAGYLMPGSAHG